MAGAPIQGLWILHLFQARQATGSVVGAPGSRPIANADLLVTPCDVLMPAALGHVLTGDNAPRIQASYILEGANGPCTAEADEIFEARGIVCIPDIYANAGGVTVSYFEWVQNIQRFRWTEEKVNAELEQHMVEAHARIRQTMERYGVSMRTAAFVRAIELVKEATDLRGLQ